MLWGKMRRRFRARSLFVTSSLILMRFNVEVVAVLCSRSSSLRREMAGKIHRAGG